MIGSLWLNRYLIHIELIRSKRDSVRKAREAHLINKAKTLHPFGINKKMKHASDISDTYLIIDYQSLLRIFYLNFYCNGFLFTYFFPLSPWGRFVLQTEI